MARLVGTTVFDPLGDPVGRVHDVVVLIQLGGEPRAVGCVIEVPGRRRVFLPLSRITAIEPGAVITTGVVNMRRFEQRKVETLVVGELLDRVVTLKDGTGTVEIRDVAIERDAGMDWKVTPACSSSAPPRGPWACGAGRPPRSAPTRSRAWPAAWSSRA